MILYVGALYQTKPYQVEVASTTEKSVVFADRGRAAMTSRYIAYRPTAREWYAWRVDEFRQQRDAAAETLNARELDLDEAERLLREEEQSDENSM